MTTIDPDATFCTEIEKGKNPPFESQSLEELLTEPRVSVSQPVPQSLHNYNTRRSQRLSQDDTQLRKFEREKELAALRLRLRQIQAKLRIADVREEESPALEQELEQINEKIGDKRTKMAIQTAVTKLRSLRVAKVVSNDVVVVPQMNNLNSSSSNIVKPKRGRTFKKRLQSTQLKSKLTSPRVPKRRSTRTKVSVAVSDQNDSDGLCMLDQSMLNETINSYAQMLDKSISLFDQKKAEPYQSSITEQLERLQEVMARTKATLDRLRMEREEAEREQKKRFSQPMPAPGRRFPLLDFDPFLAPYTESLFSSTEPTKPSAATNIKSTYSFSNDSYLPLAQKFPNNSIMEYDNILETSFIPGSSVASDNISRGLFSSNSKVEFDKSFTFINKLEEEEDGKNFFDMTGNDKPFSVGAQQSFEIDTDVEKPPVSDMEDDKDFFNQSYLPNGQKWFVSEVAGSSRQMNQLFDRSFFDQKTDFGKQKNEEFHCHEKLVDVKKCSGPENHDISMEQSLYSKARLFTPVHLELLAKRLHLNEWFLK